jgi:hypothetical protein
VKRIITTVLFFSILAIGVGIANAYGPFMVADDGTGPMRWETLKWHYDPGDLAPGVNNQTAVNWLNAAMDEWVSAQMMDPDDITQFISVATVQHINMGSLGEDVTAQNMDDSYEIPGVQAYIVFDYDGTIVEGFGFEPDAVLGLTYHYGFDASGHYITRAFVILNGAILGVLSEDDFKAMMRHEFGHLFNLDHSQVNWQYIPEDLSMPFTGDGNIPTMFPNLITWRQKNIIRDDKIGLGWIYPDSNFQNKYCTIKGEIKDADGNPLQGVNVVAKAAVGETTGMVDVRSMVSGAMYPPCMGAGEYVLMGIKPDTPYQVFYEKIGEEFTGASGFEPFPCIGDEFGNANGVIEANELCPPLAPTGNITEGGDVTVTCGSGGDEIVMDTVQLEVVNPCSQVGTSLGEGTDNFFSEPSSKGGCSLILN